MDKLEDVDTSTWGVSNFEISVVCTDVERSSVVCIGTTKWGDRCLSCGGFAFSAAFELQWIKESQHQIALQSQTFSGN